MTPVRVLLLDLAPACGLADELVGCLAAAPGHGVELLRRPAAARLEAGELDRLARCHGAQAVVLALADPPAVPWRGELSREVAAPVLAFTAAADPQALLALLSAGVADLLRPPLAAGDVLSRLWHAAASRSAERSPDRGVPGPQRPVDGPGQRVERAVRHVQRKVALSRLIGESPAFLAETGKIPLVADCDVAVLISGETGTGKELVARAIHYLSQRSRRPFLPVNCGALPRELVENELFGHERGAFTGADRARAGLVEEAEGGTLFLDEIDSLPPAAQVKLLRFLQDREYRRLGSSELRHGDVRVLAATNADVERAVAEGRLRGDLYYRLNVVPIHLPPLRARREDIPLLARHFLRRFAAELSRPAERFSADALAALAEHDWPGNVRELEHAVQRAVLLSPADAEVRSAGLAAAPGAAPAEAHGRLSFREAKAQMVARFERSYVQSMLATHHGNISRAARAARKDRRVFFELIRKHGIDASRYRGD